MCNSNPDKQERGNRVGEIVKMLMTEKFSSLIKDLKIEIE